MSHPFKSHSKQEPPIWSYTALLWWVGMNAIRSFEGSRSSRSSRGRASSIHPFIQELKKPLGLEEKHHKIKSSCTNSTLTLYRFARTPECVFPYFINLLFFNCDVFVPPDLNVGAWEVAAESQSVAAGVLEHHRPDGHPDILRGHGAAPAGAAAHELRPSYLLRQHHLLVHPAAGHLRGQQVPGSLRDDDWQNGEQRQGGGVTCSHFK